jgi:hypothetical protein
VAKGFMDKRTAAADLRARNQALLERARVAVEAFALVRDRVTESMAHSRSLLAELGTRDIVNEGLARLRRRRQG